MGLRIIGSGLGRTGTSSMQQAIEELGFGPCHHMHVVMANPLLVAPWQAVAAGETQDWRSVFADFEAQVDWPGAHVYRETAAAFPDAKVIHTTRPVDEWWASFSKTIGKLMTIYKDIPAPPHLVQMMDAMSIMLKDQIFKDGVIDRATAMATFTRRDAEVRQAIPADRLLIFNPNQGWEPLCAFLGVPVPDTPFPKRNVGVDFWAPMGGEPADPVPAIA